MTSTASRPPRTRLVRGLGIILGALYALLALAATGRSVLQIVTEFDKAPVAFSLTGLAAIVYIVATIALFAPGAVWWRVALVTISFELVFVLTVGTLTVVDTSLFPEKTVWSIYGLYYGFVPLVLPILGMIWLGRNSPARMATEPVSVED